MQMILQERACKIDKHGSLPYLQPRRRCRTTGRGSAIACLEIGDGGATMQARARSVRTTILDEMQQVSMQTCAGEA